MSPVRASQSPKAHSRKLSFTAPAASPSTHHTPSTRQTPSTFFLRSEDDLEHASSTRPQHGLGSTYGVQSVDDAFEMEAGQSSAEEAEELGKAGDSTVSEDVRGSLAGNIKLRQLSLDTVMAKEEETRASAVEGEVIPVQKLPSHTSLDNLSQPLTPIFAYSSTIGSVPASTTKSSSLRSFQLYDDDSLADDSASQAIMSGDEAEEQQETIEGGIHDPQFVMPSISIPSRRPFTNRGKHLGNLKILVAGPKGIGKTSLIRCMLQTCNDIVHADSRPGPSSRAPRSVDATGKAATEDSPNLTEFRASTKAYPDWWSDMKESRILSRRRRSSNVEPVLERNIQIFEHQGSKNYSLRTSQILQQVEKLLVRNTHLPGLQEQELLGMMSGAGGVHFDLVLLMLPCDEPQNTDMQLLEELALLTNVIPVFAKSDLSSSDKIESVRTSFLHEMQRRQIQPFLFGKPTAESAIDVEPIVPFCISCSPAPDDDMDASLMMSSEYIQPLVPSHLSYLVNRIFDPDSAAYLRYSAAKKFVQWSRATPRHYTPERPFSSSTIGPSSTSPARPLTTQNINSNSVMASTTSSSSSHVLVSRPSQNQQFSLSRLSDHTNREERLAQVHLAKWATDLQRSLQNERLRFESLQRGERAVWLTERLGECVRDGSIVAASTHDQIANILPISPHGRTPTHSPKRGAWTKSSTLAALDPLDPLGLLDLHSRLTRHGVGLFRMLSGVGLVGALTVWAARSWGWWDGDMGWIMDGSWILGSNGGVEVWDRS